MTTTETIPQPLPHKPEPVREMLRRLPAALEPLIDPDHPIDFAPGCERRHVFDFANGVRMVLTRETNGASQQCAHLSFGITQEFQKFWPSKDAFVAHASMTATLLGFDIGNEETEVLLTDKAFHVWIPINFSRRETSSVAEVAQSTGIAGAHNPASDGRAGEISRVYSCPECDDDVTFPHESVNYAECPNCHGYWYASTDAEFVDGMWKDLTKLVKANPDPEAP